MSSLNNLKSALLLSWLKESGAYSLLNGTLPTNQLLSGIQAQLTKQKLDALAALQSTKSSAESLKNAVLLAWLKHGGVLDVLSKVQNATGLPLSKLVPKGPDAGAPAADASASASLESGAAAVELPKPAIRVPGLAKLNNATHAGLDHLKSALLLSWLKESGTYDRLAAYNNATAALHASLQAASDAIQLKAAQDALANVKSHVDAQLAAAAGVVANASAQAEALKASVARAAQGKLSDASKRAVAAVDSKLAAAKAALAAAEKEAQQLLDAKLAAAGAAAGDVNEAASGVTKAVQEKLDAANAALAQVQKAAAQLKATVVSKVGSKIPSPVKKAAGV